MKFIILFVFVAGCSARNAFPDTTDNNFQNECLAEHNKYRAKHGAAPLKIDQKIVAYAKTRCNHVSQGEGLSRGHAGLKGHGENLAWRGTSNAATGTCADAVKRWYDEVSKYTKPEFSMAAGHFTQLVWKSTTLLGCARCSGKGSQWYETYVACNYLQPGNVQGQFQTNVQK